MNNIKTITGVKGVKLSQGLKSFVKASLNTTVFISWSNCADKHQKEDYQRW